MILAEYCQQALLQGRIKITFDPIGTWYVSPPMARCNAMPGAGLFNKGDVFIALSWLRGEDLHNHR